MYICLGNNLLKIKQVNSMEEIIEELKPCSKGYVILGKEWGLEYVHLSYAITIFPGLNQKDKFGVGIIQDPCLPPEILPRPDINLLIIGLNSKVVGINTVDCVIVFDIDLGLPFTSFYYLKEDNIMLVYEEDGISRLFENGKMVPLSKTGDLISDIKFKNKIITISYYDEPDEIIDLNQIKDRQIRKPDTD
jgi:hypothetical protein